MIDSHLAVFGSSAGCETIRCQTRACSPSVCGVRRSASTEGSTTHASAHLPELAAVTARDADDRGTDVARQVHRAHEVHADLAFETSATHREDEQAIRGGEPRGAEPLLVRGVPPSSLIRAVSSETLSVTQYDSMRASFRKSHAACDALPAPPPEPHRNRRPPRSRVGPEHLDHRLDLGVVDLFEDAAAVIEKRSGERGQQEALHDDDELPPR